MSHTSAVHLSLRRSALLLSATVAAVLALSSSHRRTPSAGVGAPASLARPGVAERSQAAAVEPALLARLGGGFVENVGQWAHEARFVLRQRPMTTFVEERGWVIELVEPARPLGRRLRDDDTVVRAAALRMSFAGSSAARLVPEGEIDRVLGYALGRDAGRWHARVPRYASVLYEGLYAGVDVRLREHDGHPEYDLLLAPDADLARVELRVEGAAALRLAADGALVIETALGAVTQPVPRTWQTAPGGETHEIACRYVLRGTDRFGFAADDRDVALPLTIDPGLIWSAVIGGDPVTGNLLIEPLDIAVDAAGVVTIAGVTADATFPVTMGAYDHTHNGFNDAFVARLDPSQSGTAQLVWATFLGGMLGERANAVALGPNGLVTVAGYTSSPNFPTTPNAYDVNGNGRADVFIAQLDPTQLERMQLVYSTFVGDADIDTCSDVHVDAAGVITFVGDTASAAFPTTLNAFNPTFRGGTPQFPTDSYLARLDPTLQGGAQLVYSTFFGGTGFEFATALHVDANGVATVVGETTSADFPFTPGAFDDVYDDNSDVFVIRLDPSQTGSAQLLYGTLMGGADLDLPWTVDVDAAGVITIGGGTTSPAFPTTASALMTTYAGGASDGFIAQLDPARSGAAQLLYATFVGGVLADSVMGVRVSPEGLISATGETVSTDFPTVPGAYREAFIGGDGDAFVLRIDPSRTGPAQLYYATYLGGTNAAGGRGVDAANALALDPLGVVTVIGTTDAADYPITPGAYGTPGVGIDAFVTRLDMLPTGVSAYGAPTPGCNGPVGASVTSMPTIGNGAFGLLSSGAPPSAGGVLLLSVAPLSAPVSVLGIDLWVDIVLAPHFVISATSNPRGGARLPLPIPAIPTLQGSLYAQFLWLGPTTPSPCPTLGLSASHALQIDLQP